MFRCRLRTEAQPRWKKGHPPHSTTGVASTSCAQASALGESSRCTGWPGSISDMPRKTTGTLSASDTQSRRVMLMQLRVRRLLAPSPCAAPAPCRTWGSCPGWSCTTSGCMGQTYSVRVSSTGGASGSSAMPHFGHAPGWSWRTSGSIGQT